MDDIFWISLMVGGLVFIGVYVVGRLIAEHRDGGYRQISKQLKAFHSRDINDPVEQRVEPSVGEVRVADNVATDPAPDVLRPASTELRSADQLAADDGHTAQVNDYLGDGTQVASEVPFSEPMPETPADRTTQPPSVAASSALESSAESQDQPTVSAKTMDAAAELPGKLIVFYLVAAEGEHFAGPDVLAAVQKAGLVHGHGQVFHKMHGQGVKQESIFCVANMLNPGKFVLAEMAEFSTPGIAVLLNLPGPVSGVQSYQDVLAALDVLSQELGGRVLDSSRSTMTRQTAQQLHEDIIEFEHQQKLAAKKLV